MTVAMAIELESTGIKVNAVFPGYTRTNLNNYSGTEDGRGRCGRGRARCAARPGQSDRHVHARKARNDPVVIGKAGTKDMSWVAAWGFRTHDDSRSYLWRRDDDG
jgi:NAD(P)-dependent dehydrogenase (short-subunit alcohol dehydrogenase family)